MEIASDAQTDDVPNLDANESIRPERMRRMPVNSNDASTLETFSMQRRHARESNGCPFGFSLLAAALLLHQPLELLHHQQCEEPSNGRLALNRTPFTVQQYSSMLYNVLQCDTWVPLIWLEIFTSVRFVAILKEHNWMMISFRSSPARGSSPTGVSSRGSSSADLKSLESL